jgi:hypothetical protein
MEGPDLMIPAKVLLIAACLLPALPAMSAPGQVEVKTRFTVKYVVEGSVYLDGGREAGLVEGQKLTIRRPDPAAAEGRVIAEIQVVSVASSSAACTIRTSNEAIRTGDEAVLSPSDAEALQKLRMAEESSKYAQVITFTAGDPLEEEVRAAVPKPRLPEINRARGRIGIEYSTVRDLFVPRQTATIGVVFRIDATRLMGTYWNLSGYYRGRLTQQHRDPSQETLTDLLQRTYHLSLTHNNPASRWVAGMGRLYLPWATSLGTVDGGYFGGRLGKRVTVGLFGGSAPDPTSWRYDPNRQLLGSFLNFEGGSFESLRYSTTVGVAAGRIRWRPDREFGFLESSLLYKHSLSLYYNLEMDRLHSADAAGKKEIVPARSYLTFRVQPHRMISFDLNHNYFREIPTFDARLLATGLLDRLLFQGVSAGVRLDLPWQISPYVTVGRSNKTGDVKNAWNQMYGLAVANLFHTGFRADVRYSKFDSAFSSGTYRSLSFSRSARENLRFEIQAGQQNYVSALAAQNNAWWVNLNADWILRRHYFIGGGATFYRGPSQGYTQYQVNFSYGF